MSNVVDKLATKAFGVSIIKEGSAKMIRFIAEKLAVLDDNTS